jgi:hypothetical protein
MAEISQIQLPNGTVVDIKDPVARAAVSSGGAKGWYGECSTTSTSQAKVVDVDSDDNDFELFTGVKVTIYFTNAQTYNGAPTLNVSGSGAKTIKRYGTTDAGQYEWRAGQTVVFTYDGSYWVIDDCGVADTSYVGKVKLNSSTSSTSTTEAATPSAVKAAYDLANGKQNALTFDSMPTANSTNPVTSGGVKTALDGKQSTLTFDTTPTQNSTNPVTSGGIYTALNNLPSGGATITYGNTDLVAGTSQLATGEFYAYYI